MPPRSSSYRWTICALLFFSTTFNYMDRQVISYLKEFFCAPAAQGGFGWTNTDFSNLTSAFTACYAAATIAAGWVIDRIGTRLGLALSLTTWSLFGILNAFAGPLVSIHILIRAAFGIGEAGNFPASIKTVAEWFPKRERALATAIFNSGSNFGAMAAALLVPWCMVRFGDQCGWRIAFILTGASGFLWLFFWFRFYQPPQLQPRLSAAELALIHADDQLDQLPSDASDSDRARVPWFSLFRYPQTLAFATGKFLTDGIWWFYLFWLPDYLHKQFVMARQAVMLPTFIVYGVAIIGSIYGGAIPMALIRRGMPVYKARLRAMLIIASCPLVVLATQFVANISRFGAMAPVLAVAIICIGAAAHQAWSANLYTTVSDMFPKKTVGSVIGIGTAAGGLGGVIVQKLSGYLNDAHPQSAYLLMFILCGLSYLIAWSVMRALVPDHRPISGL